MDQERPIGARAAIQTPKRHYVSVSGTGHCRDHCRRQGGTEPGNQAHCSPWRNPASPQLEVRTIKRIGGGMGQKMPHIALGSVPIETQLLRAAVLGASRSPAETQYPRRRHNTACHASHTGIEVKNGK